MHTMISASAPDGVQTGQMLVAAVAVYVCPACKGKLQGHVGSLRCDACARTYPVRNDIPDFLGGDLGQSTNWSLRHAHLFDWLAPIYETNLWYPVVMRLAGVRGVASLPELLTTVRGMMGTIQGLVLDAACGPGTFGRSIAAQSQAVFGIDISHGMLEQGRQYAQREHVSNIHFARARVEALPFPDDTFAAALCCGSLHLFEDPLLTLRQIGRTLKCGAQLVAVTFAARDTAFSRFAQRHGARLFEVDGLGNLLLLAGFEDYRPRLFGSALIFSARKTRRI